MCLFIESRASLCFHPGDELLEVDAPLEEGKIRDSNSYTLAALIEECRCRSDPTGRCKR